MLIFIMRLDLRLTCRFLDQPSRQAIVAFLSKDKFLLAEYLSRLDKTLTSMLTQLIDRGFLTGKRDELIPVASQEKIKAESAICRLNFTEKLKLFI